MLVNKLKKNNSIIAIIPARSGSKSVVDKNIHLLGGHPLIAYSIIAAKLSNRIERVIVSTDSKEYAAIAQHYGAEVPFLRPGGISNDLSTDNDFFSHAIQWITENESLVPEYWVHLRPTTPLREPLIIDSAVDAFIKNPVATSLRSGHCSPESPLKWFTRNPQGYFQGLLSDDESLLNSPKEAFDAVYIPNGYVDIISSSCFLATQQLHGDRIIGFETEYCVEVDSLQELEYLKYQVNNKECVLKKFLNSNCFKKEHV